MTDPDKIAEARKAGYSSKEIVDFLAASDPRVQQARDARYNDDEILNHLAPPPSLGRQALDEVGDFAGRAADYARTLGNDALGGVIGLPRMALEGIDWLGKKDAEHGGTGARVPQAVKEALPTPEEATRTLNLPPAPWSPDAFDEWLKKRKEGTLEPRPRLSSGSKVVDAAAGGVLSLPFTGGASLPATLASIGGPVASELAGQAAEGTDYETPARLAGAVLGAAGGAVAPSVAGKVAQAGKSIVAPFTPSGRDKIVGQTLFKMADDPAAAIAKGEAYSSPVPGFNLPAPQAMRDDALMATQQALNVPGSRFGQRANANQLALSAELDRLGAGMDPKAFVAQLAQQDAAAAARAQAALDALPAGADAATAGQAIRDALSTRATALKTVRSEAVDPLYTEARAFPEDLRISPLWRHIDDVIANSKGDIKKAAEKAKALLVDANGRPDWSAAGMMNARTEVTDMIQKAVPGSNEQRVLMGIKGEIDKSLSMVPAEQQARQTFATLSKPLDPFSAAKGAPNVARVVERDQFGKVPMLPAEKVPTQFFRPGDAGGATMKEFMATQPDAAAIDAMKSFIADKARSAPDVKAFLQKHAPAIEALDPALARQLEDAAATSTISTGLKAGPAAKFLGGDLDAAVRSTLGAPDSAKRMQTLRMSVGGDPEAVKGLQKAILDDFKSSVQLSVKEAAQDVPALSADKASKWMTANRGAIANVMSPDQVKGLEAITRALKDQAQTAVKREGSDTTRNLATMSILDAALWKGAGDVAWLSGLRSTLGLVYGGTKSVNSANAKTWERLMEVMLDPKVAAALMKKATPSNVKLAEPVLRAIARGTLAAEPEVVK